MHDEKAISMINSLMVLVKHMDELVERQFGQCQASLQGIRTTLEQLKQEEYFL